MEGNDWAFNRGPRRSQDGGWFITYLVFVLCSSVVGVLAWKNMNPLFLKAISDEDFMADPHSCEPGGPGRRLLATEEFDVQNFAHVAGVWVIASAVLALLGGLLLIHLYRRTPQTMVVIGFLLPAALCAALACTVKDKSLVVSNAIAALVPLAMLAWFWSQVKQVGRMMKVAAGAVAANPALMPFAIGTNVAVLAPVLGFGAALYFLQGNGAVVPDPTVRRREAFVPLFEGGCVDGDGRPAVCCMWQPAPWVAPVQVAVGLTLMWTMAIRSQLRTYVIGSVVTQWYFYSETRGTTLLSLRHALGPARGTLCFSGAVITACDVVRSAAEQLQRARGDDMLSVILSCVCSWILDMLQELVRYVSTLATIQAAATGEAFLEAARSVGAMLTRHALSAVSVWWVPNLVLRFTTLGISATAGVVAYFASLAVWQRSHRYQAGMDALALGVIVGLIWIMVLGWVAGFIRSATEVVYVCFARDLDNRAVTRADVHAVLKDVPAASGAVVVQPDNNLMYGAMEEGDAVHAPLHPSASAPPPGYPGYQAHPMYPAYPANPTYPAYPAHHVSDLTAAIQDDSPRLPPKHAP